MTPEELKTLKPGDKIVFRKDQNESFFIGASRDGEVVCYEKDDGIVCVGSRPSLFLPKVKKYLWVAQYGKNFSIYGPYSEIEAAISHPFWKLIHRIDESESEE